MSDPVQKSDVPGSSDRQEPSKETTARRSRRSGRSGRRGSRSSVVKAFGVNICDFPPRMSEGRLREVVEKTIGCRVISCEIGRNRQTGRLERVAHINFASHSEALRAVRVLNGTSLDGERLTVRYKGMSIFTDKHSAVLAAKSRAASLPGSRSAIRPAGKRAPPKRKEEVKSVSVKDLAEEAKQFMDQDD